MTQDLYPTTELERAFVQARNWTSLHAWRRGTSHMNSERYAQAMGTYLAMVRNQSLCSSTIEVDQSLKSLLQFAEHSTAQDSLAVVRILCSLITEINDSLLEISVQEELIKTLTQTAFSFVEELKKETGDKLSVVSALSTIKNATYVEVIEDKIQGDRLADLTAQLEVVEIQLAKLSVSGASENAIANEREEITAFLLQEAVKADGSIEFINLIARAVKTSIRQEDSKNAAALCQLLLLYTDYCNKNCETDKVTTSKHHARRRLDKVKEFDSAIFDQLSAIANDLITDNELELAVGCLNRVIPAGARLGRNGETIKKMDGLVVISMVLKKYDLAIATFELFFETVKDSDVFTQTRNLPEPYELLKRKQLHLLKQLKKEKATFYEETLDTLSEVVMIASAWLKKKQMTVFLQYVIHLIRNNAENGALKTTLAKFWQYTELLPYNNSLISYAHPLALITEEVIDAYDSNSYAHYLKVHEKFDPYDPRQQLLFWQVLVQAREEKNGKDSVTLLPLLGQLAASYLSCGERGKSCAVAERIVGIDKTNVNIFRVGVQNIVDYCSALLIAVTTTTMLSKNARYEAVKQYSEIVEINEHHRELCRMLFTMMREHQRRYPNEFVLLEPIFVKLLDAFATEDNTRL